MIQTNCDESTFFAALSWETSLSSDLKCNSTGNFLVNNNSLTHRLVKYIYIRIRYFSTCLKQILGGIALEIVWCFCCYLQLCIKLSQISIIIHFLYVLFLYLCQFFDWCLENFKLKSKMKLRSMRVFVRWTLDWASKKPHLLWIHDSLMRCDAILSVSFGNQWCVLFIHWVHFWSNYLHSSWLTEWVESIEWEIFHFPNTKDPLSLPNT